MPSVPTNRREAVLLSALTTEPQSTSQLYDRIGYPALMRVGLISYPSFRAALANLAAKNLIKGDPDDDGSTIWRRSP